MTDFSQAAQAATSRLDGLGTRYALVGGFAVSVRTEPRFTRDLARGRDLIGALTDIGA